MAPQTIRTRSVVTGNTLIAFLILALLPLQGAWPNSRPDRTIPFRLGGLRIGETLSHFKEVFPGSACGAVTRMPVNRHTLNDSDSSEDIACCVDAPELLAKFSEFRVLTVEGRCPVLLYFLKQKVRTVLFAVEAPSVEKVLPTFEKTYGPPDQVVHGRNFLRRDQDRQAPISLASWRYGDARLELSIVILDAANGHAQKSRLVQVGMWKGIDFR